MTKQQNPGDATVTTRHSPKHNHIRNGDVRATTPDPLDRGPLVYRKCVALRSGSSGVLGGVSTGFLFSLYAGLVIGLRLLPCFGVSCTIASLHSIGLLYCWLLPESPESRLCGERPLDTFVAPISRQEWTVRAESPEQQSKVLWLCFTVRQELVCTRVARNHYPSRKPLRPAISNLLRPTPRRDMEMLAAKAAFVRSSGARIEMIVNCRCIEDSYPAAAHKAIGSFTGLFVLLFLLRYFHSFILLSSLQRRRPLLTYN